MLKQRLQLKLQQKLSPQQIQLMKLLQVPTVAMEQRIKEELEINPALEEGNEEENEEVQDETLEDSEDSEFEGEENDSNNEDEFDLSDYIDADDIPA